MTIKYRVRRLSAAKAVHFLFYKNILNKNTKAEIDEKLEQIKNIPRLENSSLDDKDRMIKDGIIQIKEKNTKDDKEIRTK